MESKSFISQPIYLPDVITEYFGDGVDRGIKIEYLYEPTPLGTGGCLTLLEQCEKLNCSKWRYINEFELFSIS